MHTDSQRLMEISIHSLVKRETEYCWKKCGQSYNFNPLPRKEGDDSPIEPLFDDPEISIHSLVKRETSATIFCFCIGCDFNPLPRKEGDPTQLLHDSNFQCYFNPLPRKEGDIYILWNEAGRNGYFNPLPRKEGDYDDSRFAARA